MKPITRITGLKKRLTDLQIDELVEQISKALKTHLLQSQYISKITIETKEK